MLSSEVRRQFLEFFAGKGHTIVPSSPVVPHDDPTLLFTNAGMNQFKDVFLGTGTRPYTRAADTQKCIRAGGKHNDLDDVGHDTYHHTFFEMLGNWSFGDYFKVEAIEWAWELLTKVWRIDPKRLHATYFEGDASEGLEPDTEARDLWLKILPPDRVHPGNKKDNFWEMGDTGPCGPCSEIHIDLTPDLSGGPLVNAGDARVMEIWNLVFIQFNRGGDGKLKPLPARHVDTGMGFERICAVLTGMERNQVGRVSNYDTDVFTPIFEAIQNRTGAAKYAGLVEDKDRGDALMRDISYRVIADHLRCLTFALTDGAIPSNEGRGYVLRRILRRAVRYGRQYLNMHEPFLCDLVEPLVRHMENAFPELRSAHGGRNVGHVTELLRDEEESFGRTLDRGIKLFEEAAAEATIHHHGRISGEAAFKLHDTYGFPIDLTELMAEERGLTVNIGEYERLMAEARDRARASILTGHSAFELLPIRAGSTKFIGYKELSSEGSPTTVSEPLLEGDQFAEVLQLPEGSIGALVLSETPFYAEAGGQVSDTGVIEGKNSDWSFSVTGIVKRQDTYFHLGRCTRGLIGETQQKRYEANSIPMPMSAVAKVDLPRRHAIMQNHTATHLLNWALRDQLGDGVQQKGSLVDPDKTRFDFSHNKPVEDGELRRIEELVTKRIKEDLPVYTQEVEQQSARQINTLRAVFGEKYPDKVRVVSIGADIDAMLANPGKREWMNFSVEFCGGTHVKSTREIEDFVLISEEGVAKGVRRVVGVSGERAKQARAQGDQLLKRIRALGADDAAGLADLQRELADAVIPVAVRHEVTAKLAELQKALRQSQKQQDAQAGTAVMQRVAALLSAAESVGGVTIVTGEVPTASADALRGAVDWVRQKTTASAVFLATADEGKVTLIAGMSKDAVAKGLKAGDLIKETAPHVGGRGGGRPDMAQGGGDNPAGIAAAIESAAAWIKQRLQ